MVDVLNLQGDRYNVLVAIFFVPYVIFEFPCTFQFFFWLSFCVRVDCSWLPLTRICLYSFSKLRAQVLYSEQVDLENHGEAINVLIIHILLTAFSSSQVSWSIVTMARTSASSDIDLFSGRKILTPSL
jgi:hypothetical protein